MTQDCSYNELHALQALDDSMEPEFPKDCIIVIEPSEVCSPGAYVIAVVDGERWFRRFERDEQGQEKLTAETTAMTSTESATEASSEEPANRVGVSASLFPSNYIVAGYP